jgi:Arc/MetJ-type ribon-helix-helix transcriptional regulator
MSTINIRISKQFDALLKYLCKRLMMNKSAVIRYALHELAEKLKQEDERRAA